MLAQMHHEQSRPQAAAIALKALFIRRRYDVDLIIQAIELLDDAGRQADAVAICEDEIAAGALDPRLHAYAGMLHNKLGNFLLSRERYMYAVANHEKALEWNIPIGLSSQQRYKTDTHGDFELFRRGLDRLDLSSQARASLLFALGKAHDDIGDYERAADYLRQANDLVRANSPWSRKKWQRGIESRLLAKQRTTRISGNTEWAPLFIVGVPRSGTTLVAELLSRHADVCNRGELPWLPQLAQQLESSSIDNMPLLEQAASTYQARLLQDDGIHAKWFIDKEPMNLLRLDLIMAMYPNAKVIFCQRNARDTALSLWSQYFSGGSQGYAYDLTDISAVIQGCRRVMSHWKIRYSHAIHVVHYEDLTSDPDSCIARVTAWLELSKLGFACASDDHQSTISTGSLWQARQTVYSRSVNRWRHYEPFIPELKRLPAQ